MDPQLCGTPPGVPRARSARPLTLALAVAGALAAVAERPAHAQAPGETVLPETAVTATRSARDVDQVPASVTVKDRAALDEELVENIRDAVRDEPGVTVSRRPSRFSLALANTGRAGNEGFNIRGLEGNRVLLLVDGLRLPNAFSFGANSFGRGDYLDANAFGSIEILRGPASALYGSDGLAGAVSITTPDPATLLKRSGGDRHLGYRFSYDGADRGFAHALSGAIRFDGLEAMLIVSRRDASELRNKGEDASPDARRTQPNPQESDTNAVLSKLVYRLSPRNRLRLTMEGEKRNVTTHAISAVSPPPLTATSVLALDADDSIKRIRASVDQSIGAMTTVVADELRWALFVQKADNRQHAIEDRNTAADRVRDTTFNERSVGGTLEIDKRIAVGVPQRLTYGFDVSRSHSENIRDGVVPPVGEAFPTKAFPDTDYTLGGVFAQDEIAFAGGTFFVIPALRFDTFKLDPEASPLYPGTSVALSDSALSPKLSFQWLPLEGLNLYAYAARGYRAPTPDQVNNGFVNAVVNYRSIGNPDLKPETSRTIEVGAKVRRDGLRLAAAYFDGRYKNFIEQIQVGGSFTVADPAVFQFVNLREVTIHGAEISGEVTFLRDWTVNAAAAWAKGRDETTSLPLNSINPLQAVAGIAWQALPSLRANLDARYARQKSEGDVDSSGVAPNPQFRPPSSFVLDLALNWKAGRILGAYVAFNAGVFNLTDRKYWAWTDVRGLAANSTVLDAYTQPGRTFAANLRIDL